MRGGVVFKAERFLRTDFHAGFEAVIEAKVAQRSGRQHPSQIQRASKQVTSSLTVLQ